MLLIGVYCAEAQTGPVKPADPTTAKLTGTIYDPLGAVIPVAKVTAVGGGKTFTTFTNANGVYTLTLPIGADYHRITKYDITVDASSLGFKVLSEINGYRIFVPTYSRTMTLDIAVEMPPAQTNIQPE